MNQEEQQEYQEKIGSPEMEYLQYQMENPEMNQPPMNINVMCQCGLMFSTGIDTKQEDGFYCPNCQVPISSPLLNNPHI